MIPIFQLLKAKKLLGEACAALLQVGMYGLSNDCSDLSIDIDRILNEIEKEIDSK